jgi:hypothetical protein
MAFEISSTFMDEVSSEGGVWVDFYESARLLIASTESPKYRAALAKLARANKVRLDSEPHPDNVKLTTHITCKAMAEHVLLGWENILMGGKPIEYTKQQAYDILIKSPQLRDFVADQAGTQSLFRGAAPEEIAKNSAGSSGGAKVVTL